MTPRWVLVALLVAACGTPAPPKGFGGMGGGDEDTPDDDTGEECVTCELTDCEDDTEPEDVASEDDCSDAAEEQGCAEYSFEEGC
ncbi:MAG: hypothetical protein V4850_15610 [Myxococcota bacterium]